MRILSLILALPALMVFVLPVRLDDSPHGEDFNISCGKCHSAKGWIIDPEVYSFDHNTTALPLAGQHMAVNCKLCHPTLVFSEAPAECAQCHTDMHEQTVGNDCARCHTPHSWIVTNITQLHRRGRFPLRGAHYMAECGACHPSASSLRYEPLGVECIDCHMPDFQAARDPDHVAGNLSMECTDCHSMTAFSWRGGEFNHQAFPLTGGHNIQDCSRCHAAGDFSNAPTDCYACHQEDYQSAIDPNHSSAGFSTECTECHSTAPGWSPATFDHTIFPLTQGHATVLCDQCHDPGDYSNVSADCYACHQLDYNNTTNPNHLAASISIDCMECHTTMPGWKPASFEIHDAQFFPIYSGSHRGEWNSCTQCHEDLSNYASFTCLSCHEHSQSRMDDKHSGEQGYEYNSIACLECHPRGSED